MSAQPAAYRRVPHAAHYTGRAEEVRGHDLEQWDVTESASSPMPRGRDGGPVRPDGVPDDAEYWYGYRQDGVQHFLFVRRAPLTGTCEEHRCHGRCSKERS